MEGKTEEADVDVWLGQKEADVDQKSVFPNSDYSVWIGYYLWPVTCIR